MKVVSKEVKDCKDEDGNEVTVLDLNYTHYWEKGRVVIRDYSEDMYDYILKQVRKEVSKWYKNWRVIQAMDKKD